MQARPGVVVSGILRSLILSIYNDFLSADGRAVDYDGISRSEKFTKYVIATSELQGVDVSVMNRNEKLAFFINIYNALVIHSTVGLHTLIASFACHSSACFSFCFHFILYDVALLKTL